MRTRYGACFLNSLLISRKGAPGSTNLIKLALSNKKIFITPIGRSHRPPFPNRNALINTVVLSQSLLLCTDLTTCCFSLSLVQEAVNWQGVGAQWFNGARKRGNTGRKGLQSRFAAREKRTSRRSKRVALTTYGKMALSLLWLVRLQQQLQVNKPYQTKASCNNTLSCGESTQDTTQWLRHWFP